MAPRVPVDSSVYAPASSLSVHGMTPTQDHPLARSRVALLPLAALTVLALVGCSNTARPAPSSSLVTEAIPMFPSDEEALAAAEAAYANYVAISDEIAHDGGSKADRISRFVTADRVEQGLADFDFYLNGDLRAVGQTQMDSFRLQALDISQEYAKVTAYVCLRLADLRILDSSENDVTPVGRDDNLPLVVRLVASKLEPDFLVNSGEVWTGANFCL